MKSTRKLIPALAMLLVSAVVMTTASYAWFSMNKTVTATGLDVTVKSDSVYLLIGDTDVVKTIQDAKSITTAFTVAPEAAKVYPSAHDAFTGVANVPTAANWYTATAAQPDASTMQADTKTALTDENFAQYVIKKTCYVTLAAGSNSATNLTVSKMKITDAASGKTIAPVKVVVASADAFVELDSTTLSSVTPIAASVTSEATVKVDIYVYYNGNDDAVYTNNVTNLDGTTIELTFSVD